MFTIRLLSLDQSSNITGWAMFEDGQLAAHGKIDLHIMKDAELRIHAMYDRICGLIAEHSPEAVVIEDVHNQRNIAMVKTLGRLQGMIIAKCYDTGADFFILQPSVWRKRLDFKQGSGVERKELKQQSIDFIKEKYRICVTDDESDAICIGLAAQIK